jgi:hypothetical protein
VPMARMKANADMHTDLDATVNYLHGFITSTDQKTSNVSQVETKVNPLCKAKNNCKARDSTNHKSLDQWYNRDEWFNLEPSMREKKLRLVRSVRSRRCWRLTKNKVQTKKVMRIMKCQVGRCHRESPPCMYPGQRS